MNDENAQREDEKPEGTPEIKHSAVRYYRRRRTVHLEHDQSFSSQLMALSLFIMLLAFFIVMNAVSTYDTKKINPTLNSLEHAFASKVDKNKQGGEPSVSPSEQFSIHEGDVYDRMNALFNTQFPANEMNIDKQRGTMQTQVIYDSLKSAAIALGQRNALTQKDDEGLLQNFFIPTLVALINNRDMGQHYKMDMIYNIDQDPAALKKDNPKLLKTYISDIDLVSTKLIEAGLPPEMVTIGLQKGSPDKVDLLFRKFTPYTMEGQR